MFFKTIALIIITFFSATLRTKAEVIKHPFPQHVVYAKGSITPSHISQPQLDHMVTTFYNRWKERYINSDCGKDQYYVWFENTKSGKQCVSEGQGYGMIITVLMAGFDQNAHAVFDGLYKYVIAHPSKRNVHLMAWAQNINCHDVDGSTAADGDMDIAYAMLLADKQWGSAGRVNYLYEARQMIKAIMEQEVNPKTYTILLSNAVEHDSKDYYDTRSSDFMPANFRAFSVIDKQWNKVINKGYRLFSYMESTYSANAGLLPDFIRHVNSKAQPAQAGYLESRFDGFYNYNACRVPWRIATDYLLYGDERSKTMANKINRWIKETTSGNPDNISAGYRLDGNDIKSRNFEALSFIAPFAVSAMVDSKNQKWLNKLWDYLVSFDIDDFDYYDNSIKMLNMLIISGNYWWGK